MAIKLYIMPFSEHLEDNIIIQTITTDSAWLPKAIGIRIIHIPTKTVIECTGESNTAIAKWKGIQYLREHLKDKTWQ